MTDTTPRVPGIKKFLLRLVRPAFLQAINGQIPVSNTSPIAKGMTTLLKNGALTVTLLPVTHSERIGKVVPHKTARQITKKKILLNRKLLSLLTNDSSFASGSNSFFLVINRYTLNAIWMVRKPTK